jgi:dGTPase
MVDAYSRLYNTAARQHYDTPTAADRERILFSPAFRRLAHVTQVVDPTEGQVFHNRLTHSLRVGHTSRHIAEYLLLTQQEAVEAIGGIDAYAAEAAGFAPDIGHPPFGHIGEATLDELVKSGGESDGFEGNAQSFRIVTKLAVLHSSYPGLNLTARTLRAILKYPWLRGSAGKRARKFGAYSLDEAELHFALAINPPDERRSIEAEIMDCADDISYAIDDVDDFYRAGLIPLERLAACGASLGT